MYDAVDLMIRTRDDIDFNVDGAEERMLSDPRIQAALSFQRCDLDELSGAADYELLGLVPEMRGRARRGGAELFGL